MMPPVSEPDTRLRARLRLDNGNLLIASLLAATCLLAVAGFVRVLPVLLGRPNPIDFAAYYLAARVLWAGGDIYAPITPLIAAQAGVDGYSPYIYPPQLAWLLGGLAAFPFQPAATTWLIANLMFALLTVVALGRRFRFSRMETALFAVVYLTLPATYNVLISGQVLLLLNLLLAAILILSSQQRTRPWHAILAGILLAGTAVIKAYPAMVGPVFLLQRRWLVLTAALVTTLIAVAGSFGDSWRWFTNVLPGLARTNAFPTNQSLLGVSGRLFAVTRFVLPGTADAPEQHLALSPLINAPGAGPIVGYLAVLIVGAVSVFAMVQTVRLGQRHPYTFDLCFAIGLTSALLISPIAWSEYAVHLLIPFMALVRWRWLAFPYGVVLAIVYLFLVLEKHWSLAVILAPGPLSTMFSFFAVLLVWLALQWTVYRPPTRS